MAEHREYYKGEGRSSSCGKSCEAMFTHGLFVHQKCSNYALTNLVFGLCKFVWIIDMFITRLSPHFKALTRPSTHEVLWARECTPTPYPSIIFTLDSQLNLPRSLGGCVISSCINNYKMVYSCMCTLYLWLMLIWMKMKMKILSSIFNVIPK
jgi:hypothetical protein